MKAKPGRLLPFIQLTTIKVGGEEYGAQIITELNDKQEHTFSENQLDRVIEYLNDKFSRKEKLPPSILKAAQLEAVEAMSPSSYLIVNHNTGVIVCSSGLTYLQLLELSVYNRVVLGLGSVSILYSFEAGVTVSDHVHLMQRMVNMNHPERFSEYKAVVKEKGDILDSSDTYYGDIWDVLNFKKRLN